MKLNNVEVIILKKISIRILCIRKDYSFLTEILKLFFTFRQNRFRLNTVQKAREFLEKYKNELQQTQKGIEEKTPKQTERQVYNQQEIRKNDEGYGHGLFKNSSLTTGM